MKNGDNVLLFYDGIVTELCEIAICVSNVCKNLSVFLKKNLRTLNIAPALRNIACAP